MPPPGEPPDLSVGAIELLRIARENDQHCAIARNAALSTALSFTEQLLSACQIGNSSRIASLLGTPAPPANFLSFASLALRSIQKQLDDQFSIPDAKATLPVMTDFNVHVLQAEAQALADFAWPERVAADFDGPPLGVVVHRLARTELSSLWQALMQHYIGNILQDVFAAARIRETVRDLDPQTEVHLRSEDARKLSAYVFQFAKPGDAASLMETLEKVVQRVVQ